MAARSVHVPPAVAQMPSPGATSTSSSVVFTVNVAARDIGAVASIATRAIGRHLSEAVEVIVPPGPRGRGRFGPPAEAYIDEGRTMQSGPRAVKEKMATPVYSASDCPGQAEHDAPEKVSGTKGVFALRASLPSARRVYKLASLPSRVRISMLCTSK